MRPSLCSELTPGDKNVGIASLITILTPSTKLVKTGESSLIARNIPPTGVSPSNPAKMVSSYKKKDSMFQFYKH